MNVRAARDGDGARVEVERFVRFLWQPGEVRELRVIKHDRYRHTAAGWFQTPEELTAAAIRWDGKKNVFVTLNPVNSALLARANGRIDVQAESTTSDKDILTRNWIFIDIDPVRPSGISSTNEEVESARELAAQVMLALGHEGWPAPGVAMSGNGWYLLYPAELPNDAAATALVEQILKLLAERFDTDHAHIDPSVSNAARLVGLVGMKKVKGDSTPDRPHRRSRLEVAPEVTVRLTSEAVRSLVLRWNGEVVTEVALPHAGNSNQGGRRASGSLKDMLDAAGIQVETHPPDARGHTWYHVEQCPFHDDGEPFECGVGQVLPDGPYAGHCFHPEGSDKSWRDWKAALGLNRSGPKGGRAVTFKLTDLGNAERMVRDHGDSLRYCRAHKSWLYWDGQRWARDETGFAERLAKDTVRRTYREAAAGETEEARTAIAKHATKSESNYAIRAMLALAEAEGAFAVRPQDFDRDPWLLNCHNGTIDLKTGALRPHRREDLITKLAPVSYKPEAMDERWDNFIIEVCDGDLDYRDFVQVFFGYGLTGITNEEKFAFLHGPGGTGKGTFVEAVKSAMGDYAVTADFETFLTTTRSGGPRPDIARLAGARVVFASEADDGRRLSTSVLKQLTGGDTVTARYLYGKEFEFGPQFKLVLVANDAPKLKATDTGAWRRLFRFPFNHRVPDQEQDTSLKEYLKSSAREAVLAWLVMGCLRWQAEGLHPPAAVVESTSDYRRESDEFADFFEEEAVFTPGARTAAGDLYLAYRAWAARNGVQEPPSRQDLAARLEAAGCTPVRGTGGRRSWMGITLSRLGRKPE